MCYLAGGTENETENTKKATEEELSFIKSSICEQWKRIGVGITWYYDSDFCIRQYQRWNEYYNSSSKANFEVMNTKD